MATYQELFNLHSNSELRNKIAVAICVAADDIRIEDGAVENHANRIIWAKQAFANPIGMADQMLTSIIISNRAAEVGAILGATDAAIQSAVDAVVDIFAQGV